ncbi:DUF1566 domain-containing protein [Comamonas testosteroni]|uniref:Lcl domain-containing protein n=1 Tax=Comamonas testosteroni TaxID=285 RepID=UPI00391AC3EF
MNTIQLPAIGCFIVSQGGYLGAIMRGPAADGSQDFALIVPAAAGAEIEDIAWAPEYVKIEGADSKTDGVANTAAMAAAGLDLAKRITDLDLHGFKDWYLPATHELRALYLNVPELLSKDGWYWSSTQYSRYYAWCQDFEYGYSYYYYVKDDELRARPVRQIPLSHFNA